MKAKAATTLVRQASWGDDDDDDDSEMNGRRDGWRVTVVDTVCHYPREWESEREREWDVIA